MASFDENGKYIKTNWKAGDKITATKLNKIEESIEAVNDNDISRHVEADARLDALEAKNVAHDEELTDIKNAIADNKAASELGDYDINSRMTFLERELNEGIAEVNDVASTVDSKINAAVTNVNNVASTVDGKISTAETNMTTQVNTAKAEMTTQVNTAKNEITAQVNTAKNEMTTQVNQGKADMEAMLDESTEYMQDMINTINAGNFATKDYVDTSISGSNHVKTVNGVSPNENGNVVIPAVLDAPTIVDSIDEMTDTNKAYVLSTDGFIYTYRRLYTPGKLIPNFTNRLNTDGTDFTLNTRLSTSSTSAMEGMAITNAISSEKGDVIYVKNLDIFNYNTSYMRFGMWLDGTRVNAVDGASTYYLKKNGYTTTDGDVTSFRLISGTDGTEFSSDWDTIKFNIPMLDDYSESIITVNEPITYTQTETTYVEQWTNSGILFTPSDYGNEIAELKTITSNLAKQISDNSGDSDDTSIPNYWVNELETKAETVREIMETVGRNKSAFLWYTDAHWQHNAKKSPLLLDYLLQCTPINKVNFGGDIVGDPSPYNHDNIKMFHDWGKAISNIPNHHSVYGNHDLNHWTTDVHNMAYALVLAREESGNMVTSDIDGCYYIDNPSEKTRYLYLAYLTSNQANMMAQGQFICDAMKSVQEGWHIVAIAHRWFQYTSSKQPTVGSVPGFEADVLAMFDRYNAREKMTSGTNYFYVQDFSDCKGKVEFCIGGHIHVDYDFTSPGGIPVIITAADTNQERAAGEEEDCGVVGTITEQAVYAIIADYAGGKINVIGIGRGGSREVSLNQ